MELAECRFIYDERFPPLSAILADGAGAGSLCVGAPINDWRVANIIDQPVTLSRNGTVVRQGTAREALDDPMIPLTWLAKQLSRTGVGLTTGQTIRTGTLTGMLKACAGDTFVADFGPFGTVSATYA